MKMWLKLREESKVVAREQTYVLDAVAQHRHPLHSKASGESGVYLWIVSDIAQHFRMNHSGAQDLNPP